MGSCLSKPADQSASQPSDKYDAQKATSTGPREGAKPEPVTHVQRDQQQSPELPAELAHWTAADISNWAASLGLPKASVTALQDITGQQLLQLTDHRLLQLGVQDSAERYALLSARQQLQQQHEATPARQQAGSAEADSSMGTAGASHEPQRTAPAGRADEPSLAPEAQPETPSMGGSALSRFTAGTRQQGQPDSGPLTVPASGASASTRASDDAAAGGQPAAATDVLLEEMRDMQVLRITANGRLFRHSRPVPVSLVPYCQALCLLHDLRRGAHYHYDNCHQLLQRCVLVQDYLLALPHTQLQKQTVMLGQLSLLVQDAYDVFSQFSERGWLLRLLNSVRDQDDFNRLDQMLVSAVEAAGADTSEQPLADLRKPRMYAPQQQQLEVALKHLGGITKLLRDPLSATIRLQSLLHHLPSGSNIDTLLQQEIDHYLSSQLWFSDSGSRGSSRENSFNRVNSSGSNGSNGGVGRANSGGSGGGMLRRQSSLGPGRRPATLSVVEPFMVLRNDTVRSEWRAAFGGRERVTWKEFWYKLVQPQAHIWGLDQQLDKFTTEYVQQHLQRGSHGLLTMGELDFAFPPNTSPAMVIQAKLKEHSTASDRALPNVGLLGPSGAKARGPVGAAGWLRDMRVLQEPIPRLHNFPEFPPFALAREDEVAELVLGMADVSTNLVMLTGPQGVGRSMLAASLAQELVVSHHWTDAYWIDLQGVANVVLAGQQLMTGLGLTSDVPDTQQLLAWLEGRPRERFGIVLTHVQELLNAPAEEQQGFLDLLDNILHSSHKLQVVVVCEEALSRITYLARTVEVEPLSAEVAGNMVQQAQPNTPQDVVPCIVEACQGAPVALAVVCGLIRYGHCSAADFMRIYSDPSLPIERTVSDASTTSFLPFESRQTHERLQRVLVAAAVALPDDLVTGLLVLSLLPAPFSFEMAAPLLALPVTNNERRAIMRRLVNLGLLSYNASLQLYTMHKLVRGAARLLVHNLGLPYAETRRRFAELLVSSARRLVLPLMAKNRMLSARLAWSRLSVHVVKLMSLAFTEVTQDMLPLYVSMIWDLMPLLSSSCSSHTLQGFCQVVMERAQFLDLTLESAQVMTVLASLLVESGALKRADTMLRQALEYFWRELKGPHPAVARCYKELGGLMLKAGKPSEATKHLQQALEMQEQLFGGASPELLPVLQLQVELMRRSRKYSEAEAVVQRALGICGAAFGPNDVQVAVWKNQLAQVVRQAGRLEEAQSLAQEVLALLQGQLGNEHPRVAAQLMMLGQLAAQQGKQAVAEQTYRKALQVYQSVSGLHHPDTFNCLTSLVSLLRGAGKANHALPLAQRCMAVKKKSLGELHPDTAASMQVVADVMLDLGRYAEVESHCSRAVWVYQQLNQPASSKPVIVATTMQALALVLLGRANEAEQLATNCLEAAKHMSGPAAERNSFLASCYNCLGEVLREMGRLTDAEAAAREGLAMREKDLGANHPIVAISLQTLGHILRMRQQLPEALELAKRCEQLRASQPQGLQMAAALNLQALIYLDMGKYSDALAAGQAALAIRQKVLSNEHPDLAHSLTVVAEVLLMQDKHAEAEPLLSHAVQTCIAQLGSSHPATQRAHTLLKQATNPRTSTAASMSLSGLRLASGQELGGSRLHSVDTASSKQQALEAAAAEEPAAAAAGGGDSSQHEQQQEQAVTVPETDTTDLAPAVEDAAAAAAGKGAAMGDAARRVSDTGSPVSAPLISLAGNLISPSATNAANISIASRLNNIAVANSSSYGGYMNMGATDKVATVKEEEQEDQVDLQPHKPAKAEGTGANVAGAAIGRTGSSIPSEDAAAPADPSEWELGRQFGQTVGIAQGDIDDADAGARAYTKVLHELTRRTSLGSHDGARDTLVTSNSDAASLALAAAKAADTNGVDLSAAAAADTQQSAAAAVRAGAAASAGSSSAAAASSKEARAAGLSSIGKEPLIEDAAAELEAAVTAEEDDKLAKLHGVGDIDALRQFLREHGWQLSRLSRSEEKDFLVNAARNTWQASRNASVAAAFANAAPTAAASGAGSAAAEDLRQRMSPSYAATAAASTTRRPPARHFSFIGQGGQGSAAGGMLGLESVQEGSSGTLQSVQMSSGQLRAVQAAQAAAAAQAGPAGMSGQLPLGMLEQQQQQRMAAQYMQQQHSLPEMQWSAGWAGQEGIMNEEDAAEAEDMYYQRIAQQETEAAMNRLRAEQGWMASQQAQVRRPGPFAPNAGATMSHVELQQRLMQLQQLRSVGALDGLSEDDMLMSLQTVNSSQLPSTGHHRLQGPRGRRRRESWDVSYGPTHPMAQAAAAAAAACGYNVSGADGSGDLQAKMEAYQQQLQHSAAYPAWQQQQQGAAGVGPQQQHDYMLAGGSNLPPLQTSVSTPQQPARAQGAYHPGGLPATGAGQHMHAGQRGSGAMQQYSPLSPAGSAAHADTLGPAHLPAKGPGTGPLGAAGPAMNGTLPKYPSNMSSYSQASSRSLTAGTAEPHVMAAADVTNADGRAQQQQQQAGQPPDAHEQQYGTTVAARARSAINMARQGSSGAIQNIEAATAAAGSSALASARSEGVISPTPASAGGRSGGTTSRYSKRNVAFKLNKQQLREALQNQLDGTENPDGSIDLGSPGSAAAAAAFGGAAGGAQLQQQRSAGKPSSRPRSPLVHGMSMGEQQAQQFGQLSPHASFQSGPLYPDSLEAENLESYYDQVRTPGGGMAQAGYGLPRPHTATTPGSGGMQSLAAPFGAGPRRGPPSAVRNRSFNSLQVGWDSTDPARAHQQLLLQQQVLQVQAARLELQQQQLEIEQLLREQQQEQTAMAGQWPLPMSMAPSGGIASAASMPLPPQQQRSQQQQQYYQQHGIPNMPGYGPLQPTASTASTMSVQSPASPAPHSARGAGQGFEQPGFDSAGAAAAPHPAGFPLPAIATGPSPQSSMHTAGSSYVPSSPSASSSLSSRPALSRGTSDNQEAQVAAAMAAGLAAAAAAGRGAGMQQAQQQQQRPGSPDRKRPGSSSSQGMYGPAGGAGLVSAGSAGRQLHRLHNQHSHDEPEPAAFAAGPQMGAAHHLQQQFGWQGQQQQQLLAQQLAMQQQQQAPFSSRMGPARMQQQHFNAPAAGGYPVSASVAAGANMGWGRPVAARPFGIPPSRGGFMPSAGFSGPLTGARQMGGPAMYAAAGGNRGMPGYAMSGPLTRPEPGMMPGPQTGHPAFPAQHPAAAAAWQQTQQQEYHRPAASQGMDGHGMHQPVPEDYVEHQDGEDYEMWAAPPDYGYAGPSELDSSNPSTQLPSRGNSASRSFIAPGGGQYWAGRRSNSFGNLQDMQAVANIGSAGSLGRSGGMVRSRSSDELVAEAGQEE